MTRKLQRKTYYYWPRALALACLIFMVGQRGRAQNITGEWTGTRFDTNSLTKQQFTVNYDFIFDQNGTYQEVAEISNATTLKLSGNFLLHSGSKPNDPTVTNILTLNPTVITQATTQQGLQELQTAELPSTVSTMEYVGFYSLAPAGAMTLEAVPNGITWQLKRVPSTVTQTPPLRFIPVAPCRVVDTRNPSGPFGGPAIGAGSTRTFDLAQSNCGIPTTAAAFSLNFTVVPSASLGYITAWPSGGTRPNTSVLNSYDGRIKANASIIPAGTDTGVSVFASDETQLIIDINGYFVPYTNSNALAFFPVTPCRLVDTRGAAGGLGAPALVGRHTRTFQLLSGGCQLANSAKAYSLNITVLPKGSLGYLTIWPTGSSQPLVSTLNAPRGTITANAAIVPAGSGGAIDVFGTDDTDLLIDVNGYFGPYATGGMSLHNVSPCRVVDTRPPTGAGPVAGIVSYNASVLGCGIPSGAQALVYNATVLPTGTLRYLTLWPSGTTLPLVSTLNAGDGAITSNLAIVPDNSASISALATDSTQLILDVYAYFMSP